AVQTHLHDFMVVLARDPKRVATFFVEGDFMRRPLLRRRRPGLVGIRYREILNAARATRLSRAAHGKRTRQGQADGQGHGAERAKAVDGARQRFVGWLLAESQWPHFDPPVLGFVFSAWCGWLRC